MTAFVPMAMPLVLELFRHGRSRFTDLVEGALQIRLRRLMGTVDLCAHNQSDFSLVRPTKDQARRCVSVAGRVRSALKLPCRGDFGIHSSGPPASL
jgi:hypothetical protein